MRHWLEPCLGPALCDKGQPSLFQVFGDSALRITFFVANNMSDPNEAPDSYKEQVRTGSDNYR